MVHIPENVQSFSPTSSSIVTDSGRNLAYDMLVVAAGLQTNWSAIKGLSSALADPDSGISSIYSFETCDKVWDDIEALRAGSAIFTQPAGIVKCAGGKVIATFPFFMFSNGHRSSKDHVDGLG
jgi:sulfide:quinone oxidoreductase